MADPTITPAQVVSLLLAARDRLRAPLTAGRTQETATGLQSLARQLVALGRLECRHGRLCRAHVSCAAESALTLAMVRICRDKATLRHVHGRYEEAEAELLRDAQGQLAEALLFARLWVDGDSPWDAVIQKHMEEQVAA